MLLTAGMLTKRMIAITNNILYSERCCSCAVNYADFCEPKDAFLKLTLVRQI
jgi:hypothetical protein